MLVIRKKKKPESNAVSGPQTQLRLRLGLLAFLLALAFGLGLPVFHTLHGGLQKQREPLIFVEGVFWPHKKALAVVEP
jgi:hypothetical protein